MTFNDYYASLSSKEKESFAKRLGTSKAYLSQLNTGFRSAGKEIIKKMPTASYGNVSIEDMLFPNEEKQSA